MSNDTRKFRSLDLHDLISSGPDAISALVAALRAGTVKSSEVNTLVLAPNVASKAREELSLQWLSAAKELYEHLAQEIGGLSGEVRITDAMYLRAYFISRLGVDVREELLQVEPIAEWFLGSTPMTLKKAAESSANWTGLPIEEIRILRGIKIRLRAFEPLEKGGILEAYPAVKAWRAIRSKLP